MGNPFSRNSWARAFSHRPQTEQSKLLTAK
uniref:Uncharacterized protein n=1 Tax=Anguilla anguilla TaxID=7936 RepID=A0A0E9W823_ANGAN